MIGSKNGTWGELSRSIQIGAPEDITRSLALTIDQPWRRLHRASNRGLLPRQSNTDGVNDARLLIARQLRKHRQRENLPRHHFGNREITFAESKFLVRLLPVQRHRIVELRGNPLAG